MLLTLLARAIYINKLCNIYSLAHSLIPKKYLDIDHVNVKLLELE